MRRLLNKLTLFAVILACCMLSGMLDIVIVKTLQGKYII